MKSMLTTAAATLAVLMLVGASSQSLAQQDSGLSPGREAAIMKCTKMVRDNRGRGASQDAQRVSAWKACMTALGQQP